MSDTPRTDAALEWVRPAGNDSGPPHEQYVAADLARELERENDQLRDALTELLTVEESWCNLNEFSSRGDLDAALAKARAAIDAARKQKP